MSNGARPRKKSKSERRLIVFDLDLTLVCRDASKPPDEWIRPHAATLLETLSQVPGLDVGFWTASGEAHAREMVDLLRKKVPDLKPVFVKDQRNCCVKYDAGTGEWSAIKDLGKTKRLGWSLHSTVIVEDSPENCVRNRGNAIYVRPWRGKSLEDQELRLLGLFLVRRCTDSRVSVRSLPLQDRWRDFVDE